MKFKRFFLLIVILSLGKNNVIGQSLKYQANWTSLRTHAVPKWAKEVKFGIYAHWGVYSVSGDWDYKTPNWGNYYITAYKGFYSTDETQEQHVLFKKNVGSIEDGVGYKDLANQFTAENFDPEYWADLIEESGAKYAGMCAVHHDGFCMWDSDITDFSAGKLGPRRDLSGELLASLKDRGIKTIASFHHGRTVKHFEKIAKKLKKDPRYKNVDLLNQKYYNYYWFMGGVDRFTKNRMDLTMEYIDKYSPDVLWFDGGGGEYDTEKILAHFFNDGIKNNKEVSVHNKGNFGENFGVYSYENGYKRPEYVDWPWEDDTPSAAGYCDWPWYKNMEYKKSNDVIIRLIDLVSRNGGLLLSMNPRPDGTFDKGQVDLLKGIGVWLKQNGEAIYGTNPWKIYGEGHINDLFYTLENPLTGAKSREIQPNISLFNSEDVRFTVNGNVLYATVLGIPDSGEVLIKSFATDIMISSENEIRSIELLGYGPIDFKRTKRGVLIDLPKKLPNTVALVFKVLAKGEIEHRKNTGSNKIVPEKT